MEAPRPAEVPESTQSSPGLVEVSLPVPLFQTFTYRVPADVGTGPEVGRAVRVPFGRRRLVGIVDRHVPEAGSHRLRDLDEILPDPYCLSERQLELARWVASYYGCSVGEALHLSLPARPGTVARRSPVPRAASTAVAGPDPSNDQRVAIERIGEALRPPRSASFLLHGVTGSGKTEVYLRLIERVLEQGRSALVLLPEIALTPQTLRRIQRRFPGEVAPYHSRLSHGERCAVWEAAARGDLKVAVGARSAVFLPLRELGLIVVDEEHEPSYKADDRPRYHARDVALMRASMEGIPIVLGSATPSLESFHNAQIGKHVLLRLPLRMGADRLPRVEIIDRRSERRSVGQALSSRLDEALEQALGAGEQAIIFHNRRGFARYIQCPGCGDVVQCPRCDISLTYHLQGQRLHCHYCGFSRAPLPRCSSCGAEVLDPRGTGTQRVEVALEARFPDARILRLDQDSTTRKQAHRDILDRFGRGEADILVGTQMVAKGLHFPRVTVVGVVDADSGLHFPDLRAHERAFQLLTQVAGRSGRVGPGTVIVQTFDPEHRVLRRLRDHDVDGFLEEELEQRRSLGYPPYRRLSAIGATAPSEELLDQALERLAAALRPRLEGSDVRLLGPARAALGRINRRYRGQILLKGALSAPGKRAVLDLFATLRAGIRGGRRVEFALDVDPLQLL
jgi:primosomal protein N' (replication factor Y)